MQQTLCHMTGYDVVLSPDDRAMVVHYVQRSLLLAGADDHVVLPDLPFPAELITLLNRMGIGPDPSRVHTSLEAVPGHHLQPFSGAARRLWREARRHGCIVDAPPFAVCRLANDKGHFQERFGNVAAARLRPGVVCRAHEIPAKAAELMRAYGRAVRIKPPLSASGLDQIAVAYGHVAEVPKSARPDDRFVIQVEMPCHADASVQLDIDPITKKVTIGPVVGQHIKRRFNHGGNFYPAHALLGGQPAIPVELQRRMQRAAEVIALGYIEIGYWGPLGLDFVVDLETMTFAAIEANARVTAPRYPLLAAEEWYGEIIPFDLRSFAFPVGMDTLALADHFKGLLFRRGAREGFVPFTVIPEFGVGVGVTYADTGSDLATISAEVEARKARLAARIP